MQRHTNAESTNQYQLAMTMRMMSCSVTAPVISSFPCCCGELICCSVMSGGYLVRVTMSVATEMAVPTSER
jgi:hypothetical protein